MKKLLLILLIAKMSLTFGYSQCSCLFSFASYFETVNFYNQSNVSNAHYFWNFGDGTGSNYENPIHKFPETGNYLVTLFAKDTISNCSSYYEYWVNVTKYSTDSCQPSITDTIMFYNNAYCLKIIDNSINCNGYSSDYDFGRALNSPPNNWISLSNGGSQHARFLSRVQYSTYDTINGKTVHREAYKTSPIIYTSSKNYGDCSANFEFKVVSQDAGGQRILFTAMNETATYYEWKIFGYGTIVSNNDTISNFFHYTSNNFWAVALTTIGSTGCMDTLYQNILVQDSIQTIENVNETHKEIRCKIYPNPTTGVISITNEGLQITDLEVYDIYGKEVYVNRSLSLSKCEIDLSLQPKGIYIIKVQTSKGVAVEKVVLE